ncbi:unnamed protein product [Paramecium sonneborni]|uniref:Uncharacterized protein n=1 Tax=Paramecium sonneborni TaxID=65129 RepID=A0A8S1M060_9CILI|nr:unnamed protein product [Paramecium sonneborni]
MTSCSLQPQLLKIFRDSSNKYFIQFFRTFKMLKEFESQIEQKGNNLEDLSLFCGIIAHTTDFHGTE